MAQQQDRLARANASVIVVSFESTQLLSRLQDRLRLPFTVAVDTSRTGYRAFGLRRAPWTRIYVQPRVVAFYAKALLRGRLPALRRGQDRRQLGGDFVLDRNGVVLLAHPEKGPHDRVGVAEIVRTVEDAVSRPVGG